MKKKLVKLLIATLLSSAFAGAATINLSAGLPSQGITTTVDGVASTQHLLAVGNFSEGVFTIFGSAIVDTDKLNGQFVATGPTSLNGLAVHLFVGSGSTVENSEQFVILANTTSNPLFPADVTGTGATTYIASQGSQLSIVSSNNASLTGNVIDFTAVPEPSVAILGALGALGLIRRRR